MKRMGLMNLSETKCSCAKYRYRSPSEHALGARICECTACAASTGTLKADGCRGSH